MNDDFNIDDLTTLLSESPSPAANMMGAVMTDPIVRASVSMAMDGAGITSPALTPEQETESALREHIEQIKAESEPVTFDLMAPETLTVKDGTTGTYKKKPHVGGESFTVSTVYLGKRGDLIFVFTPVSPDGYAQMEMKENDARQKLSGFASFLNISMRDAMEPIMRARKAKAQAEESKRNEGMFESYGNLGYGTF